MQPPKEDDTFPSDTWNNNFIVGALVKIDRGRYGDCLGLALDYDDENITVTLLIAISSNKTMLLGDFIPPGCDGTALTVLGARV